MKKGITFWMLTISIFLALVVLLGSLLLIDWAAFGNTPFSERNEGRAAVRERERRIDELVKRLDEERQINDDVEEKFNRLIYLRALSTSLSIDDWSTINIIASSGWAHYFYRIGEEKDVTLTNGWGVTFRILGFNHDKDAYGNVLPITFGLRGILPMQMYMDDGTIGWHDSYMRSWLNAQVFNILPTDLREIIQPAVKNSTNSEKTIDNLFLFALAEVIPNPDWFGFNSATYSYEGRIYQFWKENDPEYVGSSWWLRTSPPGSTIFMSIQNGIPTTNQGEHVRGVSFGFAIGGAA